MRLVGLEICFSVLFWMLADIWDIGFTKKKKKKTYESYWVYFNTEPVPKRDYQSQIPIETVFFPLQNPNLLFVVSKWIYIWIKRVERFFFRNPIKLENDRWSYSNLSPLQNNNVRNRWGLLLVTNENDML